MVVHIHTAKAKCQACNVWVKDIMTTQKGQKKYIDLARKDKSNKLMIFRDDRKITPAEFSCFVEKGLVWKK